MREGLLLGLRTEAGIDVNALARRAGMRPARDAGARADTRAEERGNLICERDTWRVPKERWLFLDSIVAATCS